MTTEKKAKEHLKELGTFAYDTSNEQTVIRAAIADDNVRKSLVRKLSPNLFLAKEHRPIWSALHSMTNQGLSYDSEVMRSLLRTEQFDKMPYFDNLEELASVPDDLDWFVSTMRWDSTRAQSLRGPVPELIDLIRDPQAPRKEVSGAARALSKMFDGAGAQRKAIRPEEHHASYMKSIDGRREKRAVYTLGHEAFDRKLSEGFKPGGTSIIAGLPGAGKSTVAIAVAIMLAKQGRRPAYCAWEMSPESATDVAVSHLTAIPLRNVIQGTLTEHQYSRVKGASRWVASKIRFYDNPFFDELRTQKKRPSNDGNIDIIESFIAESGCDVFVYDLWERCLFYTKPDDVTRALVRMQEIHKEYAVHGILLHQLNLKDVEKRTDRRPTRDALKGTSAYIEIADLVFGIHREAQFKDVDDNSVETICMKQRKGEANWSVQWEWDGAKCGVSNPREVSFNPSFDDAASIGDISEIKNKKPKRKARRE